jgi:hypothetical protein
MAEGLDRREFVGGTPGMGVLFPGIVAAAADMIRKAVSFTIETTGCFVNYDGAALPC